MKIIHPAYWLFVPTLLIIFGLTKLFLSAEMPDQGTIIMVNVYGGAVVIALGFIGLDFVLSKIYETKANPLKAAKIGGIGGIMSLVVMIGWLGALSDSGWFREITIGLGSGLVMVIWRLLLEQNRYFMLQSDRLAFGMTFIIGTFTGILALSYLKKSLYSTDLIVSILLHFLTMLPIFIGLFYCTIILSELKTHRTRINFLVAILLLGLSMDLFYENYPF